VASTLTRRPLPALISLLALLVLTALVWWRVLHRSDNSASGAEKPCPTPTSTAATTTTTSLPAPQKVTVEVLNATNRTGIGARARATLVADGFQIPTTAANDSAKVPGVAEIRYGPAGKNAAKVLSYYLPGAKLVATPSRTATVVVSLGNRYSRVATPAAVQAAMARDHGTVQATTPAPSGTSKSC
jgi:hypothetical protein